MNLPRLFCLVQARQQHHHRDTLGAPVPRKVLSLTSALKHSARANSRTFKGTLASSCHFLLIACDSHSSAEQRPPREPASSIFARWQRLRLEVCFLSLLRSTSSSWPLTRLVKPSDHFAPEVSTFGRSPTWTSGPPSSTLQIPTSALEVAESSH